MILLIRNDIRLLARAASPIERARRYHVVAERIGPRLRLIVNDREIFRIHDSNPLSGSQRYIAGLFGWSATTRYFRVRIYNLQPVGQSDLLDFADSQAQKGNYTLAEAVYAEVAQTHPDPLRVQHAREGIDLALRNMRLSNDLPRIRAALKQHWPDQPFQLVLDYDGLTLDISGTNIADLEPLRGLPLRALYCSCNRIRSLEPLRGMKLVSLDCSGNPVSSLEPLRDMPLAKLICECCGITDLQPLQGMPLQLLSAGGNALGSLEGLRGLPLTDLYVWGTGIHDLSPLRGMLLTTLHCNANNISNLAPIEGMPLVTLNCAGNRIKDLSPLRGMFLRFLTINENCMSDLSPLRDIRLAIFACTGNRITSLEPLQGMPLFSVACGNNLLKSLDPFVERPPTNFTYDCDTLDTQEIERAQMAWRDRNDRPHLVREAETLLAIRDNRIDELHRLARRIGRRAYLFIPKAMTWERARAFSEKLGGHLFVVRSQEEQDIFDSWFARYWVWMGLRVTDQGPEWVTGEPVVYSNFSSHLHAARVGPKVFYRKWSAQDEPDFENCFIIEWDLHAGKKGPR